jgi:hypothetical protein
VYGYRLESVTSPHALDPYGKPKQIATLIKVDPVQAKIVDEIFERFAKAASPQAIAADVNKRNVPSPKARVFGIEDLTCLRAPAQYLPGGFHPTRGVTLGCR